MGNPGRITKRVWAGCHARTGTDCGHAIHRCMLANGAYGYLDHVASQTMVLWATGENLDGHGFTFDVKRIQASRATGNVTFSGVAGAGVAADQVLRDSAGTEFKVIAGVVLDEAGQAVANVKASIPGANGNLLEGLHLPSLTRLRVLIRLRSLLLVVLREGG
ncbi:Baseplate J family protein [Thalassospira sp. KO164]|nr:Baseplate J family protein [Thalassospira sp. KO164]